MSLDRVITTTYTAKNLDDVATYFRNKAAEHRSWCKGASKRSHMFIRCDAAASAWEHAADIIEALTIEEGNDG